MKALDWISDKNKLITENVTVKKFKHNIEKKYNQLLEDYSDIQEKYTNLLEQKSNSFDLYVNYQNQCMELAAEKRELKKQVAQLNEMLSERNNTIYLLNKKLEVKAKRKMNAKQTEQL